MLGRTRGRTDSTEDRVLQYSDEGRRECSRSYGWQSDHEVSPLRFGLISLEVFCRYVIAIPVT